MADPEVQESEAFRCAERKRTPRLPVEGDRPVAASWRPGPERGGPHTGRGEGASPAVRSRISPLLPRREELLAVGAGETGRVPGDRGPRLGEPGPRQERETWCDGFARRHGRQGAGCPPVVLVTEPGGTTPPRRRSPAG